MDVKTMKASKMRPILWEVSKFMKTRQLWQSCEKHFATVQARGWKLRDSTGRSFPHFEWATLPDVMACFYGRQNLPFLSWRAQYTLERLVYSRLLLRIHQIYQNCRLETSRWNMAVLTEDALVGKFMFNLSALLWVFGSNRVV